MIHSEVTTDIVIQRACSLPVPDLAHTSRSSLAIVEGAGEIQPEAGLHRDRVQHRATLLRVADRYTGRRIGYGERGVQGAHSTRRSAIRSVNPRCFRLRDPGIAVRRRCSRFRQPLRVSSVRTQSSTAHGITACVRGALKIEDAGLYSTRPNGFTRFGVTRRGVAEGRSARRRRSRSSNGSQRPGRRPTSD